MRKDKELVNRTRISSTVRNDLHEKFNELHKDTDIPKSRLYDKAIELLLIEYQKDTKK